MYFDLTNVHHNNENGSPFEVEGKPVEILNETIYLGESKDDYIN